MQEARLPFQAVVPDFGHAGTNLPPPPSRVARTPSRVARTRRAGWPAGHPRRRHHRLKHGHEGVPPGPAHGCAGYAGIFV